METNPSHPSPLLTGVSLFCPCFAPPTAPGPPSSEKVISSVTKRFHSHGQQLCKFIEKKESFYIRKTYFDPKGIIIRFRETAYLPLP